MLTKKFIAGITIVVALAGMAAGLWYYLTQSDPELPKRLRSAAIEQTKVYKVPKGSGAAAIRYDMKSRPAPAMRYKAPPPPAALFEDNQPEIQNQSTDNEEYESIEEMGFRSPLNRPLSTFSIDVDTASYSNMRRFLRSGRMPPENAVRIEEMINYFTYDYPDPHEDQPMSINTQVSTCPWNDAHQLAHIGLKSKDIDTDVLPSSNFVFLIDVSGSMSSPQKLGLLQKGFRLLVNTLDKDDRVAMVVYAGSSGVALQATPGDQKEKILDAINRLRSGGSTAGAAGIRKAYEIAEKNFIKDGNNRVILATDGDFNVGISSKSALVDLIEKKRDKGVFLTVLGFGTGNLKDAKMEQIADKGNGNYAYIDTVKEAEKVLVNEMSGTLFTVAKDVKIQIEFNPKAVKGYRLIGYENRALADEDFADDKKDAGELGAGQSVTALYEIIPAGSPEEVAASESRYQKKVLTEHAEAGNELMTVKLRWKKPDAEKSQLVEKPVLNQRQHFAKADTNHRFSSAVAAFGMLLRDSEHKGNATYDKVLRIAEKALGKDTNGYRKGFIKLVTRASKLSMKNSAVAHNQ